MRPRPRRDWLGSTLAAGLCALLAVCFVVPYLPGFPRDELVKTSLWGLALLASFAGWGTLVARHCAPGQPIGITLRSVWGASAFAFFGGLCAMVSGLSGTVMLVWLVFGAALLGRSWIVGRADLAREARARFRATRLELPVFAVLAFLAAAVLMHYLGGASDISSNPYDDDIVYYPFAKQLLQRGTLIDPFSFRRMSTLGGQALYHAALLMRVTVLHINVFERSMCFLLCVGLLASYRVDGRKAPLLARVVSVAVLVVLPNTSINSASYYSGLAFFLAFFQTLELLPAGALAAPRAAAVRVLPLALVGAGLCAQRQNYQATVGLVLLLSYGMAALRTRNDARRAQLVEGAVCLVLVGLLVVPWLVLLYRSNDTFLFPLMKGTFRAGVDVKAKNMTAMRSLRFFADVWMQPSPLQTLPMFMLVGLLTKEGSPRKPIAAQWLAGFLSILMLAQAFSLSDAGNLARYDYGFLTASAFLTWQTVVARAARRGRAGSSTFAWAAPVALLAFALGAPMLDLDNRARSKKMIETRLRDTDELLRRSVPQQLESPVSLAYQRLQGATPAGARLLVMVDEPYFFDYGRNEIWNLDMPGTASPRPGIPCFQGPEAVAEYLQRQGIRHVAFVSPEKSTYLYPRELWFNRIWDPDEIWRIYAPYIVDVMDNLVALAGTRVHVHDEGDMILLDLQQRK